MWQIDLRAMCSATQGRRLNLCCLPPVAYPIPPAGGSTDPPTRCVLCDRREAGALEELLSRLRVTFLLVGFLLISSLTCEFKGRIYS